MLNLKIPDDSFGESEKHFPENRATKRMTYKGTIMLCDDSTEYYTYAQVGNVSGDGMYFESDHGFKQGRVIDIRFDNPPFKSAPKYYTATVKWCKSLSFDESILPFGVGVKFL